MAKNFGEKITEGIITLGAGILIAAELPIAMAKNAIGKLTGKKDEGKEETKVTVKEININRMNKHTQEAIYRMYNKKNGIKVEE